MTPVEMTTEPAKNKEATTNKTMAQVRAAQALLTLGSFALEEGSHCSMTLCNRVLTGD